MTRGQRSDRFCAECAEIAIFAFANFHRRPEIAAISDALFEPDSS